MALFLLITVKGRVRIVRFSLVGNGIAYNEGGLGVRAISIDETNLQWPN
jgi:hypothetical protein